jgi:transcriptional regulator of acetoin/glycerol metabolism
LRVLQAQQFERVGGNETIQTNVRIIAATNRDVEHHIAAGQFRSDLYWVWLFRNDTELNKINILQRNMLEKRPLRG